MYQRTRAEADPLIKASLFAGGKDSRDVSSGKIRASSMSVPTAPGSAEVGFAVNFILTYTGGPLDQSIFPSLVTREFRYL